MPDPGSRAHKLIAESLTSRAPTEFNLEPAEWESLWAQARTHCLTPYLHQRWLESGTLNRLPDEIAERFQKARLLNSERNRKILRALEELCAVLDAAGISPVVLKGIPIAQMYYGEPSLRVLYDLDLLILPTEINRVLNSLRGVGYVPYSPSAPRPDGLGVLWRPKEYVWNAEDVFDPSRPIFVDLHIRPWEAGWHGFRVQCNLDLWGSQRVELIEGVRLKLPSDEKALVHFAVHYAFNVLEANARLMHLLDVSLLLNSRGRHIDWDGVLYDIRESRVERFCFVTLDLARRICNTEVPERVWSALRDATPRRIVQWLGSEGEGAALSMNLYQRDRSLIYFIHWAMASGWHERAQVLLYSLRNPWREGAATGRWKSLAQRMAQRIRFLMSHRRAAQ